MDAQSESTPLKKEKLMQLPANDAGGDPISTLTHHTVVATVAISSLLPLKKILS
jgi:hypothetical protein